MTDKEIIKTMSCAGSPEKILRAMKIMELAMSKVDQTNGAELINMEYVLELQRAKCRTWVRGFEERTGQELAKYDGEGMKALDYKATYKDNSRRVVHMIVIDGDILTTTRSEEVLDFAKARNPNKRQWKDIQSAIRLREPLKIRDGK